MKTPCILLADPSIRNFGYAVYDIIERRVETLGNIRTKAIHHDNLHTADIDIDSISKITKALRNKCFSKYNIAAAVIEHSTGAALDHRSSRTLALSEAAITAICFFLDIPILLPTQDTVKRTLLGKRSADKEEIEKVVRDHFPDIELPERKMDRSHPADALALLLVALEWKKVWEIKKKWEELL